jgi:hypothetical protein
MDLFTLSFYIPGTLAANHGLEFKLPVDAQLIHVSLANSAATDGIVDIGNTDAAEAYAANLAIGDSDVAAEYDRADFVGSQFPHIPKGTNTIIAVDFDGAGGTAAANLVIVLTFTSG